MHQVTTRPSLAGEWRASTVRVAQRWGCLTRLVSVCSWHGRCCTDVSENEMSPFSRSSGSADGDGFGNPDHAVEHCDGNGRFALLAGQRAGTESCADQPLVSADGGLRETT